MDARSEATFGGDLVSMEGEVEPDAPGWYPDPSSDEHHRYWNGEAWTRRRAPSVIVEAAAGRVGATVVSAETDSPAPRRARREQRRRPRPVEWFADLSPRTRVLGVGGLALLLVLLASSLLIDHESSGGPLPSSSYQTTASTTTDPRAATLPETTLPPELRPVERTVGVDIRPGLHVVNGDEGCYWERTSDLSGDSSAISANDTFDVASSALVEVRPDDAGFNTTACGAVTPFVPPPTPGFLFQDGTHAVNLSIAPGVYRAGGGELCSWARLSALTGEPSTVIEIGGAGLVGQVEMTIQPTDVGVTTSGCGAWSIVR